MCEIQKKIMIEIAVNDRKKESQLIVYGIYVSSYEDYNENAKIIIITYNILWDSTRNIEERKKRIYDEEKWTTEEQLWNGTHCEIGIE